MERCINDYFIKNDEALGADEFAETYKVEGKCIYEVIRIIAGKPLFMDDHMKRYENSLSLVGVKAPIDMKTIEKYVGQIIMLNRIRNGNIKIVINGDNLFIFSIPASYPSDEMYKKGVKTILYFGERNNPNAKVINDDFRSEVNKKISAAEAYEAILVNRDGFITEGSKSNIFAVKDGKVYTAPVLEVLPGITRGRIIDACRALELEVVEKDIPYRDLAEMDGLFISGTSPKVLPINEIEDIIKYKGINSLINEIKTKFDEIIRRNLRDYEGI